MLRRAGGLLAVLLSLASPMAAAASPLSISYSGRITDDTGKPASGTVDLSVVFYNAAVGGSVIGTTHDFPAIPIQQGVFQLSIPMSAAEVNSVFGETAGSVYIEVQALGKSYPRQQFNYMPMALRVPVDGQTLSFNAQGNLSLALGSEPGSNQFLTKDSSGNLTWGSPVTSATAIQGQAVSSTAPTAGQVLSYNGTQWVPASTSGSGSVTSVTAIAPVQISGTTAPVISMTQATSVSSGYLASSDWLTFSNALSQAGGTMNGALNMGGQALQNLAAPSLSADAATKSYVDTNALNKNGTVPLASSWNVGAQDFTNTGNVIMATSKVLGLSGNSIDPSGLTTSDKGKMWFNATANQIRYYDGSTIQTVGASGAGLTSLNGLTSSAQTFASGTSGSAPAFSSSGSVHTLNIPLAATSGVTAGLIGNSDYTAFSNKVGSVVAGAGLSASTSGGTSTVSLPAVGGVGTYSKVITDAYGRVTSGTTLISSDLPPLAASAIVSGTLALSTVPSLPASTITSGTLALAQIPSLPASVLTSGTLSASLIPDIAASTITGMLAVTNGGTGLATVGTANQVMGVGTGGTGLEYKTIAGTANEVSVTTASGLITLATPQAIGTASTPTFAGINTTGNLGVGNSNPGSLLDVSGALTERGITAPSLSSTGQGIIYFDSAAGHFKVSENGGSFQLLSSGVSATTVTAGAGLSGGSFSTNGTISLPTVGAVGTYTKVVIDSYGRVTASSSLVAGDLPSLPANILTSGTLNIAQVPSLPASTITSGTFSLAQIGSLPASAITSGTLNVAQLPALGGTYVAAAGSTMTGTLSLPANGFSAGTSQLVLSAGNVGIGTSAPNDTLQVYTSTFGAGMNIAGNNAPSLYFSPASGSTFGQVYQVGTTLLMGARGVGDYLSILLGSGNVGVGNTSPQGILDVTYDSGTFHALTVGTTGNVGIGSISPAGALDVNGTICFAGANCRSSWPSGTGTVTTIATGTGLASTTITGTGTLSLATVGTAGTYSKVVTDALGRVIASTTLVASDLPPIPASSIASGTINIAEIPSLPASQITSGTLALTTVPSLPASTISSGTLALTTVPSLPASTISSGTFALTTVPSLPASTISSGTLNIAQLPTLTGTYVSVAGANMTGSLNLGTNTLYASTHVAGTSDNSSAPSDGTLRAANGKGTNVAGANLTVAAGNGSGTGASGAINFQTAAANASGSSADTLATIMTIQPGGNVGIGTTSPQATLDIESSIVAGNQPTIILHNNSGSSYGGYGPGIDISNGLPSTHGFMVQQYQNNGDFSIANDQSPWQDFIRVNQAGQVGIYNVSPVSALDVNGGISAGTYAGVNSAPSNGMIISGNVGIATTNPTATLQVAGSAEFGTAGATFSNMGICTFTTTTALSNVATSFTCASGSLPASTALAVSCSGSSAPSTAAAVIGCRATGTANQLSCHYSTTNTTNMTYYCMWVQP